MNYSIVISKEEYKELRKHLLKDRTKEQMATALCGVSKIGDEIRLISKRIFLFKSEDFERQSCGGLELKQDVQRKILHLAKAQNLSQVDFHTHPGNCENIGFSSIDDFHESKLFNYLKEKIPGTFYSSVVMNEKSLKGRVWTGNYSFQEIKMIKVGLNNILSKNSDNSNQVKNIKRYDRQIMAFGEELQERLKNIKVGVVGLGGFAILAELITRLGIRNFVLIDNDVVEITNLNRILGATLNDVNNKTAKVEIAKRNICAIDPESNVIALRNSVFDKEIVAHLKSCDLIIISTDNHSSRLFLNRFCHQYLIPLIHMGVNIETNSKGKVCDISGEFAIVEPGQGWCLQCGQIINPQTASWELASRSEKANLLSRGYIKDIPSPAVYHLNSTIASLACAEIHNFIYQYKPIRKYLTYNALKSELMEIKVKQNKNCPVCSQDSILGLGDLEPLPDFTKYTMTQINIPNANKPMKEGENHGTESRQSENLSVQLQQER